MYEVFLTALVEDGDFGAACAVLSGLCGMSPWESFHRVLLFQGPPRPVGISNQSSIDKPIRKEVGLLWKEIHQNLTRQSFILQVRYDILKDSDLGPNARSVDLDSTPGTLRWTDFPDPPHGRPVLTQRKKVELWDQKKLPSVMRDNQHTLKGETIEEIYRFFREDIEFCLVRQYYPYAYAPNYAPTTPSGWVPAAPEAKLPAWENLITVDTQKRWFLFVKAHVLQDHKPDEIRKVQDQLLGIRNELDGVFDFRSIDRKVYDTRIAQQQQGIQTLPQKVMLGKN
ncbi:mediator complex, subunit Med18 [Mariannaea sp. PMI_226]|nr:mediator complex, subunit Med18 [Mariannaea sp. PMI_226]